MVQIWVAIITAIISPILLFVFQLIRDRRGISKEIKEIREDLKVVRLENIRSEFLFMLEHHPEDEHSIMMLHDRYVSKGGNSYAQDYFEKWLKSRKKVKKSRR